MFDLSVRFATAMIAGSLLLGPTLAGCGEEEGPAEKAGEAADEAVEELGDKAEDAADEIEDKTE